MCLQINGIQHFCYCKRQWALIEIEQAWRESADTMIGKILHKNADNPFYEEARGNLLITRAVPIGSEKLQLTGIIDVLEFHRVSSGISLPKYAGKWMPLVVEYKKGHPKCDLSDKLQIAGQVLCIEECYRVRISKSALYYKSVNKRIVVNIDEKLRHALMTTVKEMHHMFDKGMIPKSDFVAKCKRCSLLDVCNPYHKKQMRSIRGFIEKQWRYFDETNAE